MQNNNGPPKNVGKKEPTDYELEYNKNRRIRQEQMAQLLGSISPKVMREQNSTGASKSPVVKRTYKRKLHKQVAPTRRSQRHSGLANGAVKYYCDLDLDPEIPSPKTPRIVHHKAGPPTPLKVEDVTKALLDNIAQSSQKVYSVSGTTCHQCRQKTLDTKTVCRSVNCVGVRGQFCQPCLSNHYGENVKDALLNEDWTCPSCREICNCSICRTRKNKMPLGLIIHVARDQGFSNVHDFIKSEEVDEGNEALQVSKTATDGGIDKNDNRHTDRGLVVDKAVFDVFEIQHLQESLQCSYENESDCES